MTSSRKYESPLRQEQAEATRDRIMQATVDLVLAEHPATISMPEVARRAGVSVRSVYHYYPTKDALLDGMSRWIMLRIGGSDEQPVLETPIDVVNMTDTMLRGLAEYADLFDALRKSGNNTKERTARRLAERRGWIERALATTVSDLDEREAYRLSALGVVLTSYESVERMMAMGLTEDEAIETTNWAFLALVDRAERAGSLDRPELRRRPQDPPRKQATGDGDPDDA